MQAFIRGPKDFWAGVIYLALGIGFVAVARDYSFGTAIRMGPGYFPTVLGAFLALVGLISIIRGVRLPGTPLAPFAWKPVVFISLSLVLFGMLLSGGGLIVALSALLLCAPAGGRTFEYSLSGALAAIALMIFCAVVFVVALGLPLSLFGTWFSS